MFAQFLKCPLENKSPYVRSFDGYNPTIEVDCIRVGWYQNVSREGKTLSSMKMSWNYSRVSPITAARLA